MTVTVLVTSFVYFCYTATLICSYLLYLGVGHTYSNTQLSKAGFTATSYYLTPLAYMFYSCLTPWILTYLCCATDAPTYCAHSIDSRYVLPSPMCGII
jgi:hypothetical protein